MNLLECRLKAKEAQVADLSDRLRRLDISGTIRHSLLNCISSSELQSEFSELDDYDTIDGLTAIVNKLVVVAVKLTTSDSKDINTALRIYKFLFQYSFSAVPLRIEEGSSIPDHDVVDLQSKLDRLRELKVEAIDV